MYTWYVLHTLKKIFIVQKYSIVVYYYYYYQKDSGPPDAAAAVHQSKGRNEMV